MRTSYFLAAYLFALFMVACDSRPVVAMEDAGTDTARVLEASTLYGPCEQDSQCPGVGAKCLKDGFPGGYCSVACEDRTPCAVQVLDGNGNVIAQNGNHCAPLDGDATNKFCLQRCLGGNDCRNLTGDPSVPEGYVCLNATDDEGNNGFCQGHCWDDAHCAFGETCDVPSGICVAAGAEPRVGLNNGERCSMGSQCKGEMCLGGGSGRMGICASFCALPGGWGEYAGRYGYCAEPDLNTGRCVDEERMLPRGGSCGDAETCVFIGQTRVPGAGATGGCFKGCDSTAECASGLTCSKTLAFISETFTQRYSNGVCVSAQ